MKNKMEDEFYNLRDIKKPNYNEEESCEKTSPEDYSDAVRLIPEGKDSPNVDVITPPVPIVYPNKKLTPGKVFIKTVQNEPQQANPSTFFGVKHIISFSSKSIF